MRQIQAPKVTVSTDAHVSDFNCVWRDIADQGRPHQKSVAIKFDAAPIIIEMKAALDGVTLAEEILPKNICNVNILMPSIEAIKAAVCVLLKHGEVRRVVLQAIVIKRAKHPSPEIIVGEDEATEVRHERLYSRAH